MALKIPDYFALVRPSRQTAGTAGQEGTPVAEKAFAKLLSRAMDEGGATASALTVVDYLARPVPLSTPLAWRPRVAEHPAGVSDDQAVQAAGLSPVPGRPMPVADGEQGVPWASAPEAVGTDPQTTIDRGINAASKKYNLPRPLLRAVIRAESNFDPHAVSPAGGPGADAADACHGKGTRRLRPF